MSASRLAALALALSMLAVGCAPGRDTVSLTIFTDFEPREQFASARYRFAPEGGAAVVSGTIEARRFATGTGLHSATSGPRTFTPTPLLYRVELLDAAGEVIASAAAMNSFRGSGAQSVTLTITRVDCEGVGPCRESETCLCGACHPLACRTDPDADECPGACCLRAGGCGEPLAACAVASCVSGSCVWGTRVDGCGDGDWCDPAAGCLPAMPPEADSGVPSSEIDATGGGPDSDGDGVPDALDCDDGDPSRSPEAREICDNGLDENCDGSDVQCDADTDRDGSLARDDCDDQNPARHPGATEVCENRVDEDCDGEDAVCIGQYRRPCGVDGFCEDSDAQHLACAGEPPYSERDRCHRCCAWCMDRDRAHWVNVDDDCIGAATAYCLVRGRGEIDQAYWGECTM